MEAHETNLTESALECFCCKGGQDEKLGVCTRKTPSTESASEDSYCVGGMG
jgi:hypothetical protein